MVTQMGKRDGLHTENLAKTTGIVKNFCQSLGFIQVIEDAVVLSQAMQGIAQVNADIDCLRTRSVCLRKIIQGSEGLLELPKAISFGLTQPRGSLTTLDATALIQLDDLPVGHAVVDDSGKVLAANTAFHALLQLPESEEVCEARPSILQRSTCNAYRLRLS